MIGAFRTGVEFCCVGPVCVGLVCIGTLYLRWCVFCMGGGPVVDSARLWLFCYFRDVIVCRAGVLCYVC